MMTKTKNAEDGLQALAKFAVKWPALSNNVYMVQSKLGLLVRTKQYSEAKELAEKLIAKSILRGDTSGLRIVSTTLRDDAAKGQADLTALAIKAVEASYELDQGALATLLKLVETYAFAGDQAKVQEFGPKAVSAAKAAVTSDNDARGTLTVAAAYFASGDKEHARATAEKALKMVDPKNAGMRRSIEQQAAKYGAKPQKLNHRTDRYADLGGTTT
jgi:tetratricopeptide (TPR) repeat protein